MSDRERGMLGAWLGLVMGAIYGVVATCINAVILWGLPMRLDAGDIFVNVAVSGLGMAAAGFVTAWPYSSLRGVLLGALAAAAVLTFQGFLNQDGGIVQRIGTSYVLFVFFLPLAALLLSITAVLRVGVNWLEQANHQTGRPRLLQMARTWGAAVLVAAVVGSFAQLTQDEQAAVRKVHAILQQGLSASEKLPPSLAGIDEFRQRAVPTYTLEAGTSSSTDTSIAGSTAEQYVQVTARFTNGLVVQCITGSTLGQVLCSEQ